MKAQLQKRVGVAVIDVKNGVTVFHVPLVLTQFRRSVWSSCLLSAKKTEFLAISRSNSRNRISLSPEQTPTSGTYQSFQPAWRYTPGVQPAKTAQLK